MAAQNRSLPKYVQKEFDDYLRCGRLEYGFLRVKCEQCHDEKLIAFSWPFQRILALTALVHPCMSPRRGFCPSCGARRMADSSALLVDEILPEQPIRQWVLSFPFQLRFLFASYPEIMGKVLGIVNRVLSTHLIHKAGFTKTSAQTGALKVIACIEDPAVIQKILSYLKRQKSGQILNSNKSQVSLLPDERAPPFDSLFP